MNTEDLGQSRLINALFWIGGKAMESRLRHLIFDAEKTLRDAGVAPGLTVLEVGCGTGFFTVPAAKMIGTQGRLIAMDPMVSFVERVREKATAANLSHVEVIRRDALHTGLDENSVDLALLLGVLPYPTLPLNKLLPEMHRVLKPTGKMSVWLFPVAGFVPGAITRSGFFSQVSRKNRTYVFEPVRR
ncbi:class I SAM-dependent methyltransferase [Roseibium sp.]|uniref:class I SAM-dependent methyltransferase n=1 Tax=Roseibium sp. TaxID=1936156 RepID=UPI003B5242AF